jgi:cytidine deaminase
MVKSQETSQLIKHAIQAREFAQAKYSGFRVGAALETPAGKIFSGCNVESSSYGLTICAERVALTKALSENIVDFSRIAIVGPDDDFCPPCGACRQLLYDYAPELMVVLWNGTETRTYSLKNLLPVAFEASKLSKR